MKLIVGLGNKGKEYNNTRHNIGFMSIDKIAAIYNTEINQSKFEGLYTILNIDKEKVILLKPQKYMNLSGEVIKKYVEYFDIRLDDILIISDDLDMPIGKIKIKIKGSSGGHNGLKNIESQLKSPNYKRIKIGISNDKNIETKDFVLGKFNKQEQDEINKILDIIPNIFKDYLELGFDNVMNKYNKK